MRHARTLPLIAFAVAFAAIAHAAPAPSRPSRGPEQAPVLLTGYLRGERPVGNPSAIVRHADWEAFAKVLGIEQPPRVNFRTHFLFVHVSQSYSTLKSEIDENGDLRVVVTLLHVITKEPPGPNYLVQSFPRSAVKTVNGLPVPKQ
jgi:hypothetical protein